MEGFMSVLNLKGDNIVNSIVNAIVSGYRDDLIIEELAQGIESEAISIEQFKSTIDALQLYVARFAESVKGVADAMKQFEFNDKKTIIKNRPLNLAEQVMQDVEGFNQATETFYGNEDEGNEDDKNLAIKEKTVEDDKQADVKNADIKKPVQKTVNEKIVEKQSDK